MQSSSEVEKIEVLITDDNLINRMLINRIVKKYLPSAIITFAKNGQEAVDAFKKPNTNFSIIIIDGLMPVMDGFKAVVEMREWHKTNGQDKQRPTIISWSTEEKAFEYDDNKNIIGIKPFDGADAALAKLDGTNPEELGNLLIKFGFISSLTPAPSVLFKSTATTPLVSHGQFSSTNSDEPKPAQKRQREEDRNEPPESPLSKPKST